MLREVACLRWGELEDELSREGKFSLGMGPSKAGIRQGVSKQGIETVRKLPNPEISRLVVVMEGLTDQKAVKCAGRSV